jgi:hypothetical protein
LNFLSVGQKFCLAYRSTERQNQNFKSFEQVS